MCQPIYQGCRKHGIREHLRPPRELQIGGNDDVALRGNAAQDEPVFRSQKGGAVDRSQVMRIVRAAAKLAGIDTNVSPHWLRHAHASPCP